MNLERIGRCLIVFGLSASLELQAAAPLRTEPQILKRITQVAACGGGAVAGVKVGDKVAEFEAKRLKLSPQEAAKHRKAFQIGMALALCGGGVAISGTAYDKLSKHGREAREKEILAALDDAMPTPHPYADPENPAVKGQAIAQPTFVEGNEECRVVEDQIAADQALIKYCRPPNGKWSVKAL